MNSSILQALTISSIGLVMLFAALAMLYGLMYLMTALIKDREPPPVADRPARKEADSQRQVAAIAIALARAELELETRGPAPPAAEGSVSAWRTLHHQRQLTRCLPGRTRRTNE